MAYPYHHAIGPLAQQTDHNEQLLPSKERCGQPATITNTCSGSDDREGRDTEETAFVAVLAVFDTSPIGGAGELLPLGAPVVDYLTDMSKKSKDRLHDPAL